MVLLLQPAPRYFAGAVTVYVCQFKFGRPVSRQVNIPKSALGSRRAYLVKERFVCLKKLFGLVVFCCFTPAYSDYSCKHSDSVQKS